MQHNTRRARAVETTPLLMQIAIDRGGTFTDVYAAHNGREYVFKLLSVDPDNYPDAPTEGIRRAIQKATGQQIPKGTPLDLAPVETIRMGTTVATNALLERKGDRCAILVTKGFRDILRIGQQARPDIFDLKVRKLDQLYEQVFEVDERVTLEHFTEGAAPPVSVNSDDDASLCTGVTGERVRILTPLDTRQVRKVLEEIWKSGIRSLAIAYMHAYTFPHHETQTAEIARSIGFVDISVSSQVQPMIKLVSRANSVAADAYLSPIVARYIRTIGASFRGGLDALGNKLLFMQSDGGLTKWSEFSGLRAILSGPAGGVVGYALTSYSGSPVVGFDMGGTSTDVSRYTGRLQHVHETSTAEVTIQAPQLDIQTVAAGGGSILFWKKGLFVVGPESASAHPGPASYRKGGPLTITDANLFLGRIDLESFPHIFGPGENEPLDKQLVAQKFALLTAKINADTGKNLSPEQVAQGFLTVANEQMSRPIRSLTEGRGHSIADHDLSSFGGAGGQHAADVARALGISRVIIHKHSSILSAFGISLADVVVDLQKPEAASLDGSLPSLKLRLDELEAQATTKLLDQGVDPKTISCERYLNLRYKGSETFMMILETSGQNFAQDFIKSHNKEFGFSLEREILVGDIRIRAIARSPYDRATLLPNFEASKSKPEPQKFQKIYFEEWINCPKYSLDSLKAGDTLQGPAMILDETQTLIVAPNSKAIIAPNHVILELEGDEKKELSQKVVDPIQLSVFGHRFMSIAEQMGQTLRQIAISTNIKERLDFSCAIFGPDGGLVANAPHIPVHLGSMSSAVAYQAELWKNKLENGDVLVANHPAFGGSHLPDITVITPVFESGKIIFWVASRGHHSDIGGITAGSMPPFSKYLWQEGACIKTFRAVHKGIFDEDGVVERFYNEPAKYPGCSGSRSLNDSISDLKAQVAANNRGITLIKRLTSQYGLKVVQLYMEGIRDNAEQAVRELLKVMASKHGKRLHAKDYIDDGTPIELEITIEEDGSATFDFEGTGPQLYGNLNAPISTTHSAILYCLRTMINEDIPLNQGCLNPIEIKIPHESFLSPREDAATVAATTETSQRVTDVVFRAFKALAASQGTCNNFSFGFGGQGKKGFGYYETIAGGAGAGPTWHGQSGVQVHMTNTRSTDPEIFEKRYPVILREFSIRAGSGGKGRFNGGDGVVRDVEFRHPVQVSILSERRSFAPWGLEGGGQGQRGENHWVSNGKVWNIGGKNTINIKAGDRIIIKTPGGGAYGRSDEQT